MSSSIWTRCAGDSEIRALRLAPLRVVEAQHQVSTRKLVDSADEQALLEEMIESAKPPDLTRGAVHYLLFTPFRYPPLRHGSRFGARSDRGIWYGSLELRTAFAEVAYYRLLFLEGSEAPLGLVTTALTAFAINLRTERGIALDHNPFDRYRGAISSRASYAASKALGAAMREAKVEAFRYLSARDIESGVNVAAFTPSVFGKSRPKSLETWHCAASRGGVDFTKGDYFRRTAFEYPRSQFLVKGRLPAPAL